MDWENDLQTGRCIMDLQGWKSAVKERLKKLADRVKELTPGSVYGALCAATVLPVVTAAGQGDFGAVAALGGVLGGVGGNLIANRLQDWRRPQRAGGCHRVG